MDFATLPFWALMLLLAPAAFIQNMAFTAVSRSRNSADVGYHFWCSLASNGIWFVIQVGMFTMLWNTLMSGELWKIAATGIVYIISTAAGSCFMMSRMLKSEKGKRKVGASV